MAMVLHPEAQKKAQEELDKIIGNRLPEFNLERVFALLRLSYGMVNVVVKKSIRSRMAEPPVVFSGRIVFDTKESTFAERLDWKRKSKGVSASVKY